MEGNQLKGKTLHCYLYFSRRIPTQTKVKVIGKNGESWNTNMHQSSSNPVVPASKLQFDLCCLDEPETEACVTLEYLAYEVIRHEFLLY